MDGAKPKANKRIKFKLSLVAHSYKPDRFKGYLRQMSIVFEDALCMDPWTPTDILKVAAKLHPHLSTVLVSNLLHVPTCVMSPSCLPWRVCRLTMVTTRCCMQVQERLNILGGIPWQGFVASGSTQ